MFKMEEAPGHDHIKRQRLDSYGGRSFSSHRMHQQQQQPDAPSPLPLHNTHGGSALRPPNAYRQPLPNSPYQLHESPGLPEQPSQGGFPHSQPPHSGPGRDGRTSIADQGSAYSRHGSIAAPARSPDDGPALRPLNTNFEGPEIPHYPQHSNSELVDPSSGYAASDAPPHGGYHVLSMATPVHESHHGPPQTPISSYGEGDMSHGMSQQSPYATTFGAPHAHHPGSWSRPFAPQKRSTRAQQACDTCRNRKAKCDEGKPTCGYCRENNQPCVYKEVQPAKADRAQKEIMDAQKEMIDRIDNQQGQILNLSSRIDEMLELMKTGMPSTRSNAIKKDGRRERVQEVSASPMASPAVARRPSHAMSSEQELMDPREDGHGGAGAAASNSSAPSAAIDHSTGVHRLLRWESIKRLLDTPAILQLFPGRILNEDFVLLHEKQKGVLRLYGKGIGQDRYDGAPNTPASDPATPTNPDDNSARSPAVAPSDTWGVGIGPPNMIDGRYSNQTADDHPGGLNADGTLKLDKATMDGLYIKYMENIHILHPFLDKSRLRRMFDRFYAQTHGLDTHGQSRSPYTPHIVMGVDARIRSRKRKLSTDDSPRDAHAELPRPGMEPFFERRVATAIVLFVLALGKICSYRTPLQGAVPDWHRDPSSGPATNSPYNHHDSPGIKVSPSRVHSPANTAFADNRSLPWPVQEYYDYAPDVNRKGDRNVDVIPGLAYFTRGTEIMASLHGGVDVAFIQANLLASIYAAQIASSIESWSWLNHACRSCLLLMGGHPFLGENKKDPVRVELVYFAYWTCYQFESDILAELDLQPSGIDQFHRKDISVRFPEIVEENPAEAFNLGVEEGRMMAYYHFQIHMRATLNKIQPLLYPPDVYLNPRAYHALLQDRHECRVAIKAWRDTLLPMMKWNDNDDPADNILDARLRAKYFGTQYIIHRPLLEYALHNLQNSITSDLKEDLLRYRSSGAHLKMAESLDLREVLSACLDCIEAAKQSTTAFDGIVFRDGLPKRRLVVTNIFGTAHAQFGNMLVLAATYRSHLRFMVERRDLMDLLDRTIRFLRSLAPISNTLATDASILEAVLKNMDGPIAPPPTPMPLGPPSASESFGSQK